MEPFTYWPSKGHSQSGEEEILAEILRRIGHRDGFFVDLGAMDGLVGSNTRALAERGWGGLMVEGDPNHIPSLLQNTRAFPRVQALHRWVSCEPGCGLDQILKDAAVSDRFDLLSIDLDGMDYWVWRGSRCLPEVVLIEYNCHFGAPVSVPYDPAFRWRADDHYGASARAMVALGKAKGYTLVHSLADANLFFVRDRHAHLFEPCPVEWVRTHRLHPPAQKAMVTVEPM